MVDEYIKRHGNCGIILDTNLLLLFLVGSYDVKLIKKYKRTLKYSEEEYEWIVIVVSSFSTIVVTPHILAEVWNFIEKINDNILLAFIENAIKMLNVFSEDYVPKSEMILIV